MGAKLAAEGRRSFLDQLDGVRKDKNEERKRKKIEEKKFLAHEKVVKSEQGSKEHMVHANKLTEEHDKHMGRVDAMAEGKKKKHELGEKREEVIAAAKKRHKEHEKKAEAEMGRKKDAARKHKREIVKKATEIGRVHKTEQKTKEKGSKQNRPERDVKLEQIEADHAAVKVEHKKVQKAYNKLKKKHGGRR